MTDRKPRKASAPKTLQAWFGRPAVKIVLSLFLLVLIGASAAVLYFYHYYSGVIDRRLSGEVFQHTARIYAAPYNIYAGQKLTPEMVVDRLQRAGFDPAGSTNSDEGVYELSQDRVIIKPAGGTPLRLDFQKGALSRIVKSGAGDLTEASLPAELVTNLFDESREKRRIIEYGDLPKVLVNALIAAEDQRFFSHWGIDPIRLAGAFIQSRGRWTRMSGTSTLTQQLARNFFLTADRSPIRKANEIFISFLLEQRLTKQQIFTMYANEVYLGQRGSFGIRGFGEGAAAYFGKDLTALTLPEAATLVAIIHGPNGIGSPSKHPEDVKNRRNYVLNAMADMGNITKLEAEQAKQTEMKIAPLKMDATDAPYLVDYIRDQLTKEFPEDALINDSLRVYTTLDPALQKAAVAAVDKGLKSVLDQIAKRNKGRKNVPAGPSPQAAMIALNPKTGAIYAMVGGSDYQITQLNRITQAFRQPGSIFKPFVYAAALEETEAAVKPHTVDADKDTAAPPASTEVTLAADAAKPVERDIITPITMLVDEPTTFLYDGDRTYEPNNYHATYRGTVTVREALAHSLNVPTIKLAERIGYDRVASLAQRAGMNEKIKGYPSVALGAFEVTPIEMAKAYTVFANEGKRLEPHALLRVVTADGKVAKSYKYEETPVLSPQVAFMMTHLMEEVLASGTAVGVRAAGFSLPAAGKTGTSRDGWFAGYTKDFLAIAWVGYDDNRDLDLEGAHSALPIWTDFMIKAADLYPPRDLDAMNFTAPENIEFVKVDSESNLPANPSCPVTYEEAFLGGTVPAATCSLHGATISELIENGVSETGKGVGRVIGGIGRFLGNIFKGDSPTPSVLKP